MKWETLLLTGVLVLLAGLIAADRLYVSGFETHFKNLQKERVVTSNQLATAKIVYENLDHVRDLVFNNMGFPGQKDTVTTETKYFDFLTSCVNDLKLKLVSVKTAPPVTAGAITTYGYDLELEGDFFKFGELCSKFENSRRIISVESFQVELSDKTAPEFRIGGNRGIRVVMRVNTYRVRKGQIS